MDEGALLAKELEKLENELAALKTESARYEGENAAIQNENVALAAMIAGESAAADAAKRELAAAVGEVARHEKLQQLLACDVRVINDFNSSRDAVRVEQACLGWGTDQRKLLDILCNRSKEQLEEIARKYEVTFGKTLQQVLKSELSGFFEGKLSYLVQLLLTPAGQIDQNLLHGAIAGWGTKDGQLIELLGTRSASELKLLARLYQERHGTTLRKAVAGDTSGQYRQLLLAYIDAIPARNEGAQVDEMKVFGAVTAIHDGLDSEDPLSAFVAFLPEASELEVGALVRAYAARYPAEAHLVKRVIKEPRFDSMYETEGGKSNSKMLLLARLYDKYSYSAIVLHRAMKGMGSDEKAIARVLARNNKNDVVKIARKFDEMFPETGGLRAHFKKELSGDLLHACNCICFGENTSELSPDAIAAVRRDFEPVQ